MKLIVKFHSPDQNGRQTLPILSSGLYWPHLVVDGDPKSEYLGVRFMDCDDPVEFNRNIQASVKLPYEGVDYSRLLPGFSFEIKEGKHTIGNGYVKAL